MAMADGPMAAAVAATVQFAILCTMTGAAQRRLVIMRSGVFRPASAESSLSRSRQSYAAPSCRPDAEDEAAPYRLHGGLGRPPALHLRAGRRPFSLCRRMLPATPAIRPTRRDGDR